MTARSLILSCLVAFAAAAPEGAAAQPENFFDFAFASDVASRVLSAGAARRHAVFAGGRLLLGYGARASLQTGRVELYPVRVDGAVDRLTVHDAHLASLNANVHAAVKLGGPIEAGFNLDVAGASVGASQSASYRSSPTAAPAGVRASPSAGNLFLFGSNDRGSLNSEFYASWRVSPAFSLRAGLSHFLTEYRAERELASGTRLFRRFSNLIFVGVRWIPGRSSGSSRTVR